jgi:thymidylate synthase
MNRLDDQYQRLLQDIIDFGTTKNDRTGTGTKSLFGYTIRHNMKNGFPLLTTKKMAWKTMVTELLWFLRGDTNIKYLVENGCHIWDGDAYKNYLNKRYKTCNADNYKENINGGKVIRPYTQEEFINKIKTDDEFAKKWGELGPIYGEQWRGWDRLRMVNYEGIDQIANLINDLKTNPDSRRLMVNAWNVKELREMVLPPCHYGFQVYTRELSREERIENYNSKFENKIEVPFIKLNLGDAIENTIDMALSQVNIPTRAISLMWNQRSVDTFLGLPFNIASYGLLLEIIAKMVNMVPDQLIGNLGDVHLYNNHIEQAKEQIERESFELPKLNINTEFWPYEGGECSVGPIDATAVLNSFKDNNFCKCLLNDDIQLSNYQSHPAIKAPLSN